MRQQTSPATTSTTCPETCVELTKHAEMTVAPSQNWVHQETCSNCTSNRPSILDAGSDRNMQGLHSAFPATSQHTPNFTYATLSPAEWGVIGLASVSYTHLTLPTKRI